MEFCGHSVVRMVGWRTKIAVALTRVRVHVNDVCALAGLLDAQMSAGRTRKDRSVGLRTSKRLSACFAILCLLGGCSVRTDGTIATAEQSSSRSPWTANAGRFVPSGVVSFASLSAAEICGLTDEKTVSREFGFDLGGIELNFELGERGARCGFDATSDGFGGDRLDVSWYVGPPERTAVLPSSTEEPLRDAGSKDGLTRSQSVVHGLPVNVSVNGELVEATLNLSDRLIRVQAYTDNDERRRDISKHVLSLLATVHTQVGALHPRAQPEFDAPVPDVFALSPAQFCSLLRDKTVAALNQSPPSLSVMKPDSFDVTALRSDFLWCSKGRGKLELQIGLWNTSEFADQPIRGLPSRSSIGLLNAEDPRSEQTRLVVEATRPVDGGVEERNITLIAQGTAYNATSREILRNEMDHIIVELNRRLPKPLIYKLEGEETHVQTRVPLGFGEPS
jgi:hypothetical protein